MWLEIYHSKPIFNGYNPSSGRFFPFASIELNIISYFSKSPYAFFAFNASIVFTLGVLLYILFSQILPQKPYLRILLIFYIMLHPGFVVVMLGICYPERLLVLFLTLFVLSSLHFYRYYSVKSAIVGIISANIALYYKEPVFLIIGTFGFVMFLDSLKYKRGLKAYLYYILYILDYTYGLFCQILSKLIAVKCF